MDPTPDRHLPGAVPGALGALESALSARTEVSATQAERLRALPLGDLDREARAGAEIVKRLADAVTAAMYEPRQAVSFLQALDLRVVTRDHDWRAIFGELREQAGGDGQRERVALWSYMAYLCSRRELIEHVLEQRRALEATHERPALELEPRPTGIVRLPKGETVIVKLPYRGELTLYLGRHAFTLADGHPPRLLDPEGGWQKLRYGSQLVGRHPACDLVTWPDFGDVSRAHLDLEWQGDSHIAITDRSSRGTFVDAEVLATGPVAGPCAPARTPCRPAPSPCQPDGESARLRDAAPCDESARETVVRRRAEPARDADRLTVVKRPAAGSLDATRFHRGD